MPTPYVYERQVEYWTSRGVEDFFLNAGFDVLALPLTQLTEKDIPADFLFLDRHRTKLFGLQYKALYRNGDDAWHLNFIQHGNLAAFDWIYYGFSDLRQASQSRNALHYLRILSTSFQFRDQVRTGDFAAGGVSRYVRWGAFFDELVACRLGRRVEKPEDVQRALWPHDRAAPREVTEVINDAICVNFDQRRAILFSSRVADERGAV